MSDISIKQKLQDSIKEALKSKDKVRSVVLRLIQSSIKQIEVDKRITLDDDQILPILDKMVKDRRNAIKQFEMGNRPDLVEKENNEIQIIQEYLPEALSELEIKSMITDAISKVNASSAKDIGKVMGILKPSLQGRADIGSVSGIVKSLLNS